MKRFDVLFPLVGEQATPWGPCTIRGVDIREPTYGGLNTKEAYHLQGEYWGRPAQPAASCAVEMDGREGPDT